MNYEKKYLKYKKKYLNLKGGANELTTKLQASGIKGAETCAEYINKNRPGLATQENGLIETISEIKQLQDAGFSDKITCRAINLTGKINDAIKLKKEYQLNDVESYIGARYLPPSMMGNKESTQSNLQLLLKQPKPLNEYNELNS